MDNPSIQATQTSSTPLYMIKSNVDSLESEGAVSIRKELNRQYNTSTMEEKMTIDFAVSAYLRLLECTKIYDSLLNPKPKYGYDEDDEEDKTNTEWTYEYNQNKINLIKELGKQINMANQQYMAAVTFLKELKRPPINIKVQTKQAFVAENQQFNKNA